MARACSACHKSFDDPHASFSKNQLSKGESARCRSCVDSSISGGKLSKEPGRAELPVKKKQKTLTEVKKGDKKDPNEIELHVKCPEIFMSFIEKFHLERNTVEDVKDRVKEELRNIRSFVENDNSYDGPDIPPPTEPFSLLMTERYDLFAKKKMQPSHSLGQTGIIHTFDAYKVASVSFCQRPGPVYEVSVKFGDSTRAGAMKRNYLDRPEVLLEKFEADSPFRESNWNDVKKETLVGDYDVLCDWGASGDLYEGVPGFRVPFRRLPHISLQIQKIEGKKDEIEGTIKGSCLLHDKNRSATFSSDEMNSELRSLAPGSSVTYRSDIFTPSFYCEAVKIIVHADEKESESEADHETNSDEEDEDGDERGKMRGGIFVFHKRFGLRRKDIPSSEFTTARGEEMAQEYENAYKTSFLQAHLQFPLEVCENIFSFWRTEPPPSLFFEKGDILISILGDSVLDGDANFCIIARPRKT